MFSAHGDGIHSVSCSGSSTEKAEEANPKSNPAVKQGLAGEGREEGKHEGGRGLVLCLMLQGTGLLLASGATFARKRTLLLLALAFTTLPICTLVALLLPKVASPPMSRPALTAGKSYPLVFKNRCK